jgi:argininosuccinate lyase
MKKLWEKEYSIDQQIETFSIGQDQTLDLQIAQYDIIGSIAHSRMLAKVGLISTEEQAQLATELKKLLHDAQENQLVIQQGIEDIHSQIELILIQKLGDTGKKIHTARSRNDQVLLDLRLFFRAEIKEIVTLTETLFTTLQTLSEEHKEHLLPGYTHLQMAMVSSFGLWFGAFAESLADDLQLLLAAYKLVNQNPLGSAAGYGTSLPIDRSLTTALLGFEDLSYNVVHAQLGRGKTELQLSFAMAGLSQTVGKLATDVCLFMNPGFAYVGLPDNFTTGSSIMPHKKNPDIFELVRGRSNQIMALPGSIIAMTTNLPSGYHRDFQLLKETIFPAIQNLKTVLSITNHGIENITINKQSVDRGQHQFLFTVEAVNDLVKADVPFREAYGIISKQVEAGTFHYDKKINHSHEGSLGNLCTAQIKNKFAKIYAQFQFDKVAEAMDKLIS